jgi:PKHD-type hydroxylase
MFLEIADLLSGEEVTRLRAIAARSRFLDGRLSNPHSNVKNNVQQDIQDPAYRESSALLQAALLRHPALINFALPKLVMPPMMTRHEPGMAYGAHTDTAFMSLGQATLRTDLSCTIFLTDPAAYAGGELCVHLGTRPVMFKPGAGCAVVYPSTTLHEVRPVTAGSRLVAITFIESRIPDAAQRELLFELSEVAALEGLTMQWQNRVRLGAVIQALQRAWS